MKKFSVCVVCIGVAMSVVAQEAQRVDVTSFEDDLDWQFTGGTTVFSIVEPLDPAVGVQPLDGDYHLLMEYDTSLDMWGTATLTFPGDPVDLTGMRTFHIWVYFLPDAQPHPEEDYVLRFILGGDIEVDLGRDYHNVAGEWVEYTWDIDLTTMENDVSAVSNIGLQFMPGAENVTGVCYIDNIYATRPADFPDEIEYIQLYSFDEEGDSAAPLGWRSVDGEAYIGEGDVEPKEGTNYMEIILGEWWVAQAQTTNAKSTSDRLAEAIDITIDVMLDEEFGGDWSLINIVLMSGGTDTDGNPLEPVNGWDTYGERDLRWSGFWGEWKTMSWPVHMDRHLGALGEDGWFVIELVTNQDASQAGHSVYVDNMRIAVPVHAASVMEWSIH